MAGTEGATRLTMVGPREVALSRDGGTIYVAGPDGTVSAFSAATGAVLSTWAVGKSLGGMDVSADGRYLVVTEQEPVSSRLDQNGNRSFTFTVHRLDLGTGQVRDYDYTADPSGGFTSATGAFYDAAVLANGQVLLSQRYNGSGWINLKTLDLDTGVYAPTTQSVRQDSVLSLTADRTRVLVGEANISNAQIDLYQLQANGTLALVGTNGSSGFNDGVQAISPDGRLSVNFIYNAGLLLFDGTLKFVENLTNRFPDFRMERVGGLAFDATGEHLFVLDQDAKEVIKISTSTWQRVGAFTLDPAFAADTSGRFGNDLLVAADGKLVAVGASGVQLLADAAFRAAGVVRTSTLR